MGTEPLIFESSVAALIQLASDGRSAPPQRLREAGVDPSKPLLPAYPAKTWAALARIVAETLYPKLSPDEALKKVGAATITSFGKTERGKAILSFLATLGPKRHLERMNASLKTGANFIETRCKEVGPRRWELWINDVTGVAPFYAGMIEEGSRVSGGVGSATRIILEDPPSALFEISWSEESKR